jgi:hypothetical protein
MTIAIIHGESSSLMAAYTSYVYTALGEKLRTIHYTAMPNITVEYGKKHELSKEEILSVDSTEYMLKDMGTGTCLFVVCSFYYVFDYYCMVKQFVSALFLLLLHNINMT